ncbi:MAG: hypothetical protein Q9224_002643 [Gallowayella concinna]
MSAFTSTATTTQFESHRHYGKLAGVGYSQDMEIDQDLPRQIEPSEHSEPMDTTLDLKQPRDQDQSAVTEPGHGLPEKPPVAQDAPAATEQERVVDKTADILGPTAHKPARIPYLQQDLLTLFGLDPLAATVARTDPNTGEKINKMRKSYEGKVKAFGLAGRNRAVKHDHEKSMGLLQMAQWPAEEWHNQKIHGRDVRNGLSEATVQSLGLAMQMQPGAVLNTADNDWDDLLGNEKAKPLPTLDERAKKPMRPEVGLKSNGQINGIRPQASKVLITDANRPKRTGKKRRYDDHSFEGYGEGFLDDDGEVHVDPGGNSSDDGSRKGGVAKKRRKVAQAILGRLTFQMIADVAFVQDFASGTSPTMGDRRGSYGIGMLGVGSGMGAYGRI